MEPVSSLWCPVARQQATGTSWNIAETYETLLKQEKTLILLCKWLNTDTGCTEKLWSFCPWTQSVSSRHDPEQPAVTGLSLSKGGTDLSSQALSHFHHAVVLCSHRTRGFMNFSRTSDSYFILFNKLKNKNIIKIMKNLLTWAWIQYFQT